MRLEYRPFAATSDPKNPPQVIEVLVAELGQLGLVALGKNLFDLGVRAGNDVD